jgi:peptidoglycan/LPS O-acetylase OafA/YrhL
MHIEQQSIQVEGQIVSLASVRGIAAVWVVLLHFSAIFFRVLPESSFLAPLFAAGVFAVPLFFILSGYVLSLRYLVSLRAPTGRAVFQFLWLRFGRVYPVHMCTLLASVVLVSRRGWPTDEAHTFSSFIANCLLTHAWSRDFRLTWNYPSWSISSEWGAYLLFPLLAVLMSRATRAANAVVVVIACAASALVYADSGALPFKGLLVVVPTFVGGVGLGILCPPSVAWSPFVRYASLGLLPLFVLPFVVMPGPLQSALYILLSFSIVGMLGCAGNRCGPLLRSRPLGFLGDISYSLYMTHALTITLISRFFRFSDLEDSPLYLRVASIISSITMIFVASIAVYYTVERPMRGWSRRIVSR